MSSIIENLNEIVSTKNEIKGIINDNGLNAGEVFSDYPDMLRTIISTSGGASGDEIISYISSYLGAYNYIDQTKLSANSYISMADVSACGYITESDVAQMGYITMADVSACGYITSADIPDLSTYVTYSYLYSYVGEVCGDIESLLANI